MQASLGWQGCQACGDFCSFARSFRAGGRVRLLRRLTCWAVMAHVAPGCRVGLLWHLRARLSCRAAVVPAVVALLRAVAACRDYRNLTARNKKNGILSKQAAIVEQHPGSQQQQKTAFCKSRLQSPCIAPAANTRKLLPCKANCAHPESHVASNRTRHLCNAGQSHSVTPAPIAPPWLQPRD